jgi:murein DD-endopeptidase MepM/ murein hydrolase activator NlpD
MRKLSFRFLLIPIIGIFACHSIVAADEQEGPRYQVQDGDTLYSIAQKFGGDVQSLQSLNGIENPSLISIGQILLLSDYFGVSGLVDTYAVQPGESFFSMPLELNNGSDTLIKLNRIVNPYTLFVGQPLIYKITDHLEEYSQGGFSVVGERDTLLDLAINADCSPYELMLLNDWSNTSLTLTGEFIYLPVSQTMSAIPSPFEDIVISNEHPSQGHPVVISIDTDHETSVTGLFDKTKLKFSSIAGRQVSLLGVHAMSDPGVYQLLLTAVRDDGQPVTLEMRLPVADAQYGSQRVILVSDKAKLLEDENIRAAEDQIIADIVSIFTENKLWEDGFGHPISMDYITTRFGMRRSYNGSDYLTFHGGVDFGASEGTPIYAPAAGVVVMSKTLDIRGSTTIIDHGIGVYTGYWHQKESEVSVGQKLAYGELIGYVGNTGLSTGPHLHWEVWVNGTQVDPLEWIRQTIN